MPRVTGPFMSLTASGTLAKVLTASKWKGQAYMRVRVIPKNLQTDAQQAVRAILGTLAKAAHAILTAFEDTLHVGSQFFLDGTAHAPSGQSWISWMQMTLNSSFATLRTTYLALGGTEIGYYDTEAAAMAMFDYVDPAGVTQTAGFQLYLLAVFAASYLNYTGFASGPDAASSAELTAFATYCQTSA